MGKSLVLAEKPSVGKEIARVLGCRSNNNGYMEGDKYVVTWALGHLVTLAEPEAYDNKYKKWDMDDLPMLPANMKLTVIKDSSKQYKTVSSLMKRTDIDSLIIATDAGREGELVARWIMRTSGWKKPAKRLWISSQTDKAIRDGFNNLQPAAKYDNLFKSAEARSEADWLIGLNVTRALTCKYNASLSAGRVQTPTLQMIVRREEEIKRFVPQDYWTVVAKTQGFNATWRDRNGQSRIFDKERADTLVKKTTGKTAILVDLKRELKHNPPPSAYDLTELQRDANKRFAYSAKETLQIMQSLYETHKVLTYPRTDSRFITDDVARTIPERLRILRFGDYKDLANTLLSGKLNTRYIVNNSKVTDHHAIIPTEEPADYLRMSGPERNIYDLVVRRFLAVLMKPYEYEQVTLTLKVEGESFTAKGRTVKDPGWRAAYDRFLDSDIDDDEDSDEKEQYLPGLRQGDKLSIDSVTAVTQKTKPPSRFTEATLLTAMEHPSGQIGNKELSKILEETSGLGTPATRADIIEKLFSSFCLERVGKQIIPTAKGVQLIEIAPPELCSAELTAKWEKRLALISKGDEKKENFVSDMRQYAQRLVTMVKSSDKTYVHENMTRDKCPDCGKFLLAVKGKRGKMLVCPDRECGYRKSVSTETNSRCPNCHKKLELRGEGEKRIFACVCGFRERLSDFDKRRKTAGAGKADVERFLRSQKKDAGNNALAEQLKKWQNSQN